MKTFAQAFIRRFGIVILALTLLMSLAGSHIPTTYAATHTQAKPQNTSLHRKPTLNGWNSYVAVSIDSTSGRTLTLDVRWGNASGVDEAIGIYYGDGSSETYGCSFNCGSGSTTFTHTYPRHNTNYHVSVQLWWEYPTIFNNNPVEQATGDTWILTY